MSDERSTVLPDDVAREFGAFILDALRPYLTVEPEPRITEIVAGKVFAEALRVAEQVDFGE